ncbi:hypothetical protein EMCRGX_G011843 [Ephydatia muelleri]
MVYCSAFATKSNIDATQCYNPLHILDGTIYADIGSGHSQLHASVVEVEQHAVSGMVKVASEAVKKSPSRREAFQWICQHCPLEPSLHEPDVRILRPQHPRAPTHHSRLPHHQDYGHRHRKTHGTTLRARLGRTLARDVLRFLPVGVPPRPALRRMHAGRRHTRVRNRDALGLRGVRWSPLDHRDAETEMSHGH